MGDLSLYFSRREFKCHCNDPDCRGKKVTPSFVLLRGLDTLRKLAGAPITVNRGISCEKHNKSLKPIPGAKNSRHLPWYADAADIVIKGKSVREMAELALQVAVFRYGGIGIYKNRIHVDTRNYIARWPKACWQTQTEFKTLREMEKTL